MLLPLVGAALAASCASASAAGPTVVTADGSGDESRITVTAAQQQDNAIRIGHFVGGGGRVLVTISDGETDVDESTAECVGVDRDTVRCVAPGLDELIVNSGDSGDLVALRFGPSELRRATIGLVRIRTGSGPDKVNLGIEMGEGTRNGAPNRLRANLGAGADAFSGFARAAFGVVPPPKTHDYRINGTAGNDMVGFTTTYPSFGPGVLLLRGGSDNDRIRLQGRGTSRGDGGKDRLIGGEGIQDLFGGFGDDHLAGGPDRPDLCNGGRGDDTRGNGCET